VDDARWYNPPDARRHRVSQDSDSQTRARVGDVLNDKWTLERLLGAGGMGAVYAGRHRNGARAAVKVLHRYLSLHADVRARFLREGYAANRVDRPGVVKVLDDDVVVGGPDDGTAYLVMEMLEGQSLEERVAKGWKVTEREFLAVADAVLDVLDAAHTNGVVHRDIKPENIFLARDESGAERIKVLDFGLARLLEGHSTTTHGIALGTPSFMSPEQAAGRNEEVDGRTDLFALAASGFRLLAGRRIHEGSSPIDLTLKMASLPAPPIRSLAPRVSGPFARVIDRALAFRREDRYETAAAMRADVQKALAELDAALHATAPAIVLPVDRSMELSTADFEHTEPPATVVERQVTLILPVLRAATTPTPATTPAVVAEPTPEPPPVATPTTSASAHPEESLAVIPMQRSYLVRLAVALAVVGVGGLVLYERFDAATRETAPTEATVRADAVPGDAGEVAALDAPTSLVLVGEPSAVGHAVTTTPKPRALPGHAPAKASGSHVKPYTRPKH
jgi:serine/threonine protein kinase